MKNRLKISILALVILVCYVLVSCGQVVETARPEAGKGSTPPSKAVGTADNGKSEDGDVTFTEDYVNSLKDKLVLITLGKNGSEWRYKGKKNRMPTITVKPVDTTGAGDAFFAGALSVIDKNVENYLTDEVLNHSLQFGNIAGALNTTGRGAIDNLPDLTTIRNYFTKKYILGEEL